MTHHPNFFQGTSKMDLSLSFAADYAAVDASGKLNILGVFSRIFSKDFPTMHRSLYLVLKFNVAVGEYDDERKLVIKLIDSDAKELALFSQNFVVPSANRNNAEFPVLIEFRDLVFPEAGRYEFAVFVDKDKKGEIPLDVDYLPEG